jgi:hypothetical protein
MTSITVKKADTTTDIVYDILSQSAGDGTWAKWRQDTGNSAPFSARPVLAHRVTESAKGVRRVDLWYEYPYSYTDTTTSQVVVSPLRVTFKNGVWTVPQGIPATVIAEATAQGANLMGSAHIKAGLANQTAYV